MVKATVRQDSSFKGRESKAVASRKYVYRMRSYFAGVGARPKKKGKKICLAFLDKYHTAMSRSISWQDTISIETVAPDKMLHMQIFPTHDWCFHSKKPSQARDPSLTDKIMLPQARRYACHSTKLDPHNLELPG